MSPINGLSEQKRLPRLGKIHLQRTKKCKYSPAQEPCVLREPSTEACRICLKANYERETEVGSGRVK